MKERVLVDFHIRCERQFPNQWGHRTLKQAMADAESWAKDFEHFVRDHRSQDPVSLEVHREYEDRCSYCGMLWEEDSDGLPLCCNQAQDDFDNAALTAEETNRHGTG